MAGWSLPDALTTGQVMTQTNYNDKIVASIVADSHAVFPLGGSRSQAIPTGATTYQDAPEYIEFEVPTTSYTGFVYKAIVEMKTENAATTVTPKIRNITDSTDAVVGSAATSTTWGTYQTLTFTVTAGKKYRLMASKSDDVYQAWIIGTVRRTHT
jgi:hypothetical protein